LNDKLKTDSVLDLRYLVNVLIELQLAIRKLSLYSLAHTLIPTLLENLEKHFHILFEFVDEMTLGITRNEFIYQGSPISSNNPVIRQLAKRLNPLGLASISFIKGLTKDDIFHFLKFIIESGKTLPGKRAEAVFKLHEETQYIRVRLIRFGEALRSSQEADGPAEQQRNQQDRKGLWQNLVTTLMDENPDAGHQTPHFETEENANPGDLAALINHLCKSGGKEAKSYERTIVKYLNNQEDKQNLTPEERVQFNRELSTLLTRLEPEVRQQIFRISLEETEKEKGPLEEVLPFFSEPMLLEVFNQIHLSNQNISAPMVSLLNKFTELSAHNSELGDILASKLDNEKNIFRDLLTNKADRVYYPSSYRSLLDQDLVQKLDDSGVFSGTDAAAVEPAAVNYHLALIILELLEGPIGSQSEYGDLIHVMNQLLKDGLGDQTHAVLQDFLLVIFNKLETANAENRQFFEVKIRIFISPEFLASLLQSLRVSGDDRLMRLFGYLKNVAGTDFIRILLDQLETEENMSARKYLLQQIIQCGKAVIPQAVQRLKSPKWFVVRNMLVLLKDLKAKEVLPEIQRYFVEAKSSKVKLAALQALETIGIGTDFFYKAMSTALGDQDPSIIRHAVSMILSSQDPKAVEALKTVLQDLYQMKNAVILLQMVKKSNATELTDALEKLRRRLRLRFWQGSHIRALLKTVNETIRELSRKGQEHA
jgi:hypothetical protein